MKISKLAISRQPAIHIRYKTRTGTHLAMTSRSHYPLAVTSGSDQITVIMADLPKVP